MRKLKDNDYIFNNIQSIKIKKNKNFKSNIYDNIFTNITYDDESNDSNSNDRQIENKNNNFEKDKESDKYDKAKKRKINQLSGLITNNNKNNKFIKTEQNQEDKTSFLARILKNKIKDRKLKFDTNKLYFYNKNSISKKTLRQNYHSSSLSTQKTKETNVNNEFSSDARIDSCKSTKRNKN